ncbi:MAG: VanW family protein [Clostridia bacterium]|nr:VanW family protein [Clostridia bacterium]
MSRPRRHREAMGRTPLLQWEEEQRAKRDREPRAVRAAPRHRRSNHTAAWLLLSLFSLAGILLCAYVALPQLTGFSEPGLPKIAFVGRELVSRREADLQALAQDRSALGAATGVFGPGIVIDDLDVSDMTLEEARAALAEVPASGGGTFNLTIQIDSLTWHITSDQVPMTRNTEEVLFEAWGIHLTPVVQLPGETLLHAQLRTLEEREANPHHYQTRWSFDRDSIRALTDAIARQLVIEPVSAAITGFDPQTRQFTVSQDQNGIYLDADELHRLTLARLDSGDLYGVVTMELSTVLPPVTAEELRGRLGRISGYTTKTTSNKNRNTNIRLSAEAINGFCVEPGMLFSFNMTTGQRTERAGYKPAAAISGGQSIEEIGGGVCQTSSTLFNAVARGNFEIISRSPHAWPSSYVEKGLDATVNWPGLDFQWRNNSDYPVYIVAAYADRQVTVELYGVQLGEGITIELESEVTRTIPKPTGIKEVYNPELPFHTRQTTVTARKGYEVDTWQVWYRYGEVIDRKLLCHSTYKAYQETVEYNY